MRKLEPTAAEGLDIADRFLHRHLGRLARGRGTPLGWEPGRKRRGAGSGVRQVIVDRDLTWRPALSGIGYGWLQIEPLTTSAISGSRHEHRTYLHNAGGSPAIGARYVYRQTGPRWLLSTPVDVPAQGAQTEVLLGQAIGAKVADALLGSIGATETLVGAIFCHDFLNRRWCFPIPAVEQSVVLEPIVWRRGSNAPGWASSPEIWRWQPS